ncbi:MAG: hypothetical protein AAF806_21315, partial [Bacteroidota bacterium]
MTIALNRIQFYALHTAIENQYRKDCKDTGIVEIPSVQSKKYGFQFGKKKDDRSIKYFMEKHPKIKSYIDKLNVGEESNQTGYVEINGKNLYNKYKEYDNGALEIKMASPLIEIYLLYIGCENIEEFLDRYDVREKEYFYTAYYYSKNERRAKTFDLKFSVAGSQCTVIENGFHDGYRKKTFEGKGIVKHKNLFITLKNENGVESVLIIPTGGINFKVNAHYHAVFSTISKDDFP